MDKTRVLVIIWYTGSVGIPRYLWFFMVELKLIHDKKIRFSPHQILFHSTMTKRNFILVGQGQDAGPRSIKLYGSSSILGLINDHRETPCLALDDWDHINRLLLDALPG